MISKNNIKYVRSLGMKKARKEKGVFVAEGGKLVSELIGCFVPQYVAATREWIEANQDVVFQLKGNKEVVIDDVTEDELRRISFQESPQGVLAVFLQPQYNAQMEDVARHGLCLALDEVQNPGNFGTIMRVADWFGIEHIFCTTTCADVFNPKTVQATMGALARVKVHYCDLEDCLKKLPEEIPVYGTFLDGENIYTQSLEETGVIIMGNEGRGISEHVGQYVSKRILIPNYPLGRQTSESLNVAIATSIVCAEFRRRSK